MDARRHRARAADDAGARALLRGPRALEEHAQHVHDVRRRARGGDRHVGARRLLARLRRAAARSSAASTTRSCTTSTSSRATGRRSRTCCSWPSRRPSASSRSRSCRAPSSSGCASAPFLVFAALWSVLVYAVLAHWAFGGGWLQEGGTLDFAGGVPVEMGSGFSALAAALVVGARKDYGRQALLPHNAVYVLLGAGLLWFGWFGFNGGSGFSAGERRRARVHQHAADPGVHARRLVRARPRSAAGGSRRSARRRRSSSAASGSRRPAASSARAGRWLLGALAALPSYAVIVWRPRTRRRRDARRARRPRHRGPHRHPLHRLLRAGVVERRVGRAAVTATPPSSADQALAVLAAPAYAFVMTFADPARDRRS